ncbi:MAG: hypothetical protein AAGE01_24105 [Pseudomonadota bacterium]
MRRCFTLLIIGIPLLAGAQTSAYEDHLVNNLALVDAWQGYLEDFPAKPNLAPPGDVPALARAVAEIFVAFHDDHVSEHEDRLREEFEAVVIKGIVDQYPVIQARLQATASLLEAGRTADPTAFDFRLARLVEMVEWDYFALPLLLYEGRTPYHAMYRDATVLYEQHTGRSAPGNDLAVVTWPAVAAHELGSTEVVSIGERRRREDAKRSERQEALAAQIQRDNEARAATAAAGAAAAQAAAQREVAQELARVEALMTDAVEGAPAASSSGAGVFGLLLFLVLCGSGVLLAARRGWLPAEVARPVLATAARAREAIQNRKLGGPSHES